MNIYSNPVATMALRARPAMEIAELEFKSIQYRRTILTIIKRAKAGHTGGSLSCLDILNVLYNQVMDITPHNFASANRDHYVHSKGHSVEALYTVLADKGFFPVSDLDTLCRAGSHFVGHPTRKIPGIEQNTGALGHGLPVAAGMALAGKLDGRDYRVFTIMGDGELTEGSIWEGSISAAHYALDNLVVIVDRNTLQITGRTEQVMRLEPLAERFAAFGYAVRSVDGNNVAALSAIFAQVPFEPGKPNLVLAHTTKGKGISFIEDAAEWHHHVPTDAEFAVAMQELQAAEKQWQEKYAAFEPR
jgi:transketolase